MAQPHAWAWVVGLSRHWDSRGSRGLRVVPGTGLEAGMEASGFGTLVWHRPRGHQVAACGLLLGAQTGLGSLGLPH